MKILVIEDEAEMRDILTQSLEKENFVVESASDFISAMDKVGVYDYDCILLDINLPGGSGLDILKDLQRSGKSEGVIIVSARNSVDDKVEGLALGADDYLAKPFHTAELTARVKSILRRKQFNGSNIVTLKNLSVDFDNRQVSINGQPIELNRKEFDILTYFMANRNRLVSKTALAEHVWGDQIDEADSYEFIYSQIKNLRKKLKTYGSEVEIQAVYGIGYKLSDSDA